MVPSSPYKPFDSYTNSWQGVQANYDISKEWITFMDMVIRSIHVLYNCVGLMRASKTLHVNISC